MASPTDIRKGRVIVFQGNPHLVLEMLHRTQGRQAGFVQTTLRNLQSGSTTTTKFRSTDNVEFLHTTTQKLEYSYKDNDGFHFMDLETYEDSVLSEQMIGDDECFLVEGNNYDILLVDGDPVRLELPASVEASNDFNRYDNSSSLVYQEGRCDQIEHSGSILLGKSLEKESINFPSCLRGIN